MEKVMAGLQWRILALYLDDVVVFADNVSRHLNWLGLVWDCCRKAGLKLKPRKCQLLRQSVAFLGHIIDADRVHTDPDKVQRHFREARTLRGGTEPSSPDENACVLVPA